MKLYRVEQALRSAPLNDVRKAVESALDGLPLKAPHGDVAITVGSRGICNLPAVIHACGRWLHRQGARPFIVPAMGSHNGATAEGQRQMIESLGITESAMDMPIRASMEVVKLADVATGSVYMDRCCYEAAGVLVVNRIKLHTCFSGPVQSGLTKMMVVGMGKIRSAETFHSASTPTMKDMLLEMGRCVLQSGKIFAGLAILEDGHDQTAEIHALSPEAIPQREPELLERYRRYFPTLPADRINVLVVDSIGKTFSGTGMDTNVIARRGIRGFEDVDKPDIRVVAALRLAEASQGNAIGVGLADFITRRLRDAIDEHKTLVNVLATGEMERAKIPATLINDEALCQSIRQRFGDEGWMFIPNTLRLGVLYVTEDLAQTLRTNPRCRVARQPVALTFKNGWHQLSFA